MHAKDIGDFDGICFDDILDLKFIHLLLIQHNNQYLNVQYILCYIYRKMKENSSIN